tara:strand:- start:6619 stop:7962 length:1344 start_codon:yes stop_codon:yes gene_type:complete
MANETALDALPIRHVLPKTTGLSTEGHLSIGGCDIRDLANQYGTPLYIFDEIDFRGTAQEFRNEFGKRWENVTILYAAKAYLSSPITKIVNQENLGMDVVSGTELAIALKAGMAPKNLYFHGNNKSSDELKEAIQTNGSGRIIVDNFHELDLLEKLCREANLNQSILLRISPNVDPHTHSKTTTGILDSKFGFPIATGAAEEAIRQASASEHLDVCGIHIHLGSPIFELEPYQQGIEIICEFASEMLSKHQFSMREFSPGGGFALAYTRDQHPPTIAEYAELITNTLRNELTTRNLPNPLLHIEPGRSLIGRSMIAVYTVGARKEIPDIRTYVSLDGGMADNIRPAMYGSKYEAISVDRPLADTEELVTLAGKYCESGDILVENASLPKLEPQELIAIPASGGYNLAMSSNYNMALRPPVIGVKGGESYLLQRRETLEDLTARDISL